MATVKMKSMREDVLNEVAKALEDSSSVSMGGDGKGRTTFTIVKKGSEADIEELDKDIKDAQRMAKIATDRYRAALAALEEANVERDAS